MGQCNYDNEIFIMSRPSNNCPALCEQPIRLHHAHHTKLNSWPSTYPSGDDILAVLATQRPQTPAVHAAEAFSAFEIINVITASCDGQQPVKHLARNVAALNSFSQSIVCQQMKNILDRGTN